MHVSLLMPSNCDATEVPLVLAADTVICGGMGLYEVNSLIPEHPLNAPSSMKVIVSGRITDVTFLLSLKASFPIPFTVFFFPQ